MDVKTFCFDLDETICSTDQSLPSPEKYVVAKPIQEMVELVNSLYTAGHVIILCTARASRDMHMNHEAIECSPVGMTTKLWLRDHNVRYTCLRFGKPWADFYVDDKAVPAEFFRSLKHYTQP